MADTITISVVYAKPEQQRLLQLDVAENCTVKQAIELSGLLTEFPEIDLEQQSVGVFYKTVDIDAYQLKDGDRIEIYRSLIIDPKAARLSRANQKRGRKWRSGKV